MSIQDCYDSLPTTISTNSGVLPSWISYSRNLAEKRNRQRRDNLLGSKLIWKPELQYIYVAGRRWNGRVQHIYSTWAFSKGFEKYGPAEVMLMHEKMYTRIKHGLLRHYHGISIYVQCLYIVVSFIKTKWRLTWWPKITLCILLYLLLVSVRLFFFSCNKTVLESITTYRFILSFFILTFAHK